MAGQYVFDTVESQFDTILYAINCSSLVQIACNDDGYGVYGLLSLIGPLSLDQGEKIALVVDGYGSIPLSQSTVAQLNIRMGSTEYEQE